MHKWRVTVQMTYETDVYTADKDELVAHEYAIDVEDPDYHTPHIEKCVYLGEVEEPSA